MKKALTITASVLVLLAVSWKVGTEVFDRKAPCFSTSAEIYVYPNMTNADVLDEVIEKCDPVWKASVRRSFRKEGLVKSGEKGYRKCKTGHYVISEQNSSIYVARMLKNGWQTPVNLVLSGSIRQRSALARKISSQMLLDSLSVIDALGDSVLLSKYGFNRENVFGLIMPDTYKVYWTDSMNVILDKQKAAWDAFWTEENLTKAKIQGLTPMEVSTLASIVRSESNYVPEYPMIAAVYLNRLHKGMKLQADPTVAFCYDYTLNRILKAHLKVDSPYNTYKHAGLPPAPICSPGKDAMNAVLNPAGSKDILYFCASPDFNGRHLFAATYSEHLRNARAFQRALTARHRNR